VSRRPRALLVSPLLPQAGGNGLAMRAGTFLDALAGEHEVTLLVVPVAGGATDAGDAAAHFALRRAHRLAVLPLAGALDPLFALSAGLHDPAARLAALRDYPRPSLCRWATTPALDRAISAVTAVGAVPAVPAVPAVGAAAHFDTVVVLRSYLAPYAAPFLAPGEGGSPLRVLDLDDDERRTHSRLAEMHERRGQPAEALLAAAEAAKYALHEDLWTPRFDLLLAVSEVHAAALELRHPGAALRIVPNTVEVPDTVRRPPRAPALRLLFVGNLGYEPNVDAAIWLAQEIVPRLRAAGLPAELRLAGSHPAAAVAALAEPSVEHGEHVEHVELCADPADLAPHYAWADVALAPVRAGGGTRIKILEAFAARVPVVATAIGAEGLAARDGEHLLIAGDAASLAAACRRLHDDADLARRLAANALDLVRRRYARPAGLLQIRDLFLHPPSGTPAAATR
jgi:glycosyltransferase involved in cell wall biosynthesis